MSISSDHRPHIVIVTTAFAPFLGGAEVAVQEIIRHLSGQFRFTVVTARMNKDLAHEDVWESARVIRVGWGTGLDKLWLIAIFPWYAWKLKHQSGAELVWAIMASYAGAAACAASTANILPYALTLQEGDDLPRVEQRVRWGAWFFRQIFVRARGVHTIADFLAVWAQKLGARVQPVVIPNGVSCEAFQMTEEERRRFRTEVRNEYQIPVAAPVVLSVSRLVKKNGIGDLIDALQQLQDTHLLLVGDGALFEELHARALPIAERIHFLGTRQQHELRRIAAAADIFCRPAHSEGQGIVFLEALCMRLPVVATTVGGIPNVITHGEHGLLVAPHSSGAIAQALYELTHDHERYAALQRAGTEHVKQFSWNLLAPHIAEWLLANLKPHTDV